MKQLRNAIFISVFIAVIAAVFIAFININTNVDKTSLKQDIASLTSYTKETDFIVKQYTEDKLPFAYVKTQIQYLNKKTLDLVNQLASTTIPDTYKSDVNKIEAISIQLSQQQSTITSSHRKNKVFSKERSRLKEIERTLDLMSEKYE
jgi:hypothetical protein